MPALVAGINVCFMRPIKDVDGRDKPGHDGGESHSLGRLVLLVSGGFAMIYVVDAKFLESTARDADRCLQSPPGVVRDRARVEIPEPVIRRLPRRKVK
jgi:hypothetical protein